MGLKVQHPQFTAMLPDWEKTRDVYRGSRHVKERGATYLPPTSGMILDGYGTYQSGRPAIGQTAYEAYKLRAVVPEYVEEAVDVFIGLMHDKPPTIELPAVMEPLRDKITPQGESIEMLLRRVNEEQLVTGRLGLLLDMPRNPDQANPLPYIALYVAEAGINWDDNEIGEDEATLNMVVLDESGFSRERGSFEWKFTTKLRVLDLEVLQKEGTEDEIKFGNYRQGVFTAPEGGDPDFVESDMAPPLVRNTPLDVIPFVFVNTKDIVASPDKPPLLTLAEACLVIYRGEADYRQNLFMQGQDTLVVIGDIKKTSDPNELAAQATNEPLRTGVGSMIHLDAAPGSDAKYAGVGAEGLSEQRTALENDRKRAEAKSGALSSDNAKNAESGEALKTRVAARTSSLNSVAKTGAASLEHLLKIGAKWIGANPDEVKITPNLEFADFLLDGAGLAAIVAAKRAGAPLSWESIHDLMSRGNLTEMDYETEKAIVDKELEDMQPAGTEAGGNPDNDPPAQR